jgi:hypothetical protein
MDATIIPQLKDIIKKVLLLIKDVSKKYIITTIIDVFYFNLLKKKPIYFILAWMQERGSGI